MLKRQVFAENVAPSVIRVIVFRSIAISNEDSEPLEFFRSASKNLERNGKIPRIFSYFLPGEKIRKV